MNDVLPIGKVIPRVGKRIYISYGEPIDYTDLHGQKRTKKTAQIVVDRAIADIRKQQDELRTRAAER